MTATDWLGVYLLTLVIVPISVTITVYFSVKLGTYAYFAGKRLFHQEERGSDGDDSTEA